MSNIFKIFIAGLFILKGIEGCSQSSANYAGGALNWSALPWVGGTAPTNNNGTYSENLTVGTIGTSDNMTMNISFTLTGNLTINSSGSNPTITIPFGVTVVINGNLTDNNNNVNFTVNGTLIVTGTLTAKNNAVLGGSGTVAGGTLSLNGNGGSAPSCSGTGCPVLSFNDCNTNTDPAFCSANNTSGGNYVWNGSSNSDWQIGGNWTPTRSTPANSDFLTFPGSGAHTSITNVPNQTVGNILVTGNSTYSFAPAASGNSIVLSKPTGKALQIDNSSTLSIGIGNTLNLTAPSGGTSQIGGQLSLVNGNYTINSSTLILHSNSSPLARTSGQVTANSSTVIQFGTTGLTGGAIVLPSSIFNGNPTINSIVMNTTSATLGDQPITVSSAATLTFGILNSNSSASLVFSATASNPTESTSSYINGYATMSSRAVNTGALTFLGFTMASGTDNVGNMTIIRRTGASGINSFSGHNSDASSWDVTATSDPGSGRTISLSWPTSTFDNGNTPSLKFQDYLNTGSGFNPLGALQNLSSQGPPRVSANVSTTKLNGTFTLADQTNTLPITLTSFTGSAKHNFVSLFWETESELNNDYFTVLRATSGTDFKAIGTTKGGGTTKIPHSYTLIDNKPFLGMNYYRLIQTDFDGKSSSSETIVVEVSSLNPLVSIYPNPLSSNQLLNVEVNGLETNVPTEVQVISTQGTTVNRATINTDSDGVLKTSIAVTGLSSGLYILKVQNVHYKFVIE